ncbi:MAG TPA: DNA internalization-related competence protein ComEC/Rec2 [Thermoanaerobaculia bacterium]|nr:DNA internalization-related competence protein ComEC/Rec2 [Thermoanaerobaculia bacterium]
METAPRALPPLSDRCPLLLPAILVVAGAWEAARLSWLPVPLLVALGCAGLALGRRAGVAIAWLALGLVWAEVRWVGPGRSFAAVEPGKPVTLGGDVVGCWAADDDGASATLAVDRLEQGRSVRRTSARVRVHLPIAAGEVSAVPACGGRLAVRGYLRPPHRYRNAVTTEVGGWSLWVKGISLAVADGEPDLLARASGAARARLFLRGSVPERERPGLRLARALLLGDGGALPAEQREAMRRVGLAHLVAVSGLNVGMVAALILVLLLRAPRPWRLAATLLGVGAYAVLVGPLPSLLRALLMAAALLGALLLRRLPAALNGLAASCLLLVLLDPSWVEDLGFQLSVAATAGLLALSAPLRLRLRAAGPLAAPLAVTLAAQLATLPWALAAFGRLTPISPLANLIAVPWSGVALAVALAWAALRLLLGGSADLLLPVLDLLAAPLAPLARLPASPWITLPLRAPWPLAWAITLLLAACALRPRPRWRAWSALATAGILLAAAAPPAAPRLPELVMFDVGQGDSLLLRDGAATLLVDGGGWRRPGFGGRVLVPALAALGIRRLDAAAVTHPDTDHCGGVVDLLRELPVGEVWAPPGMAETHCGEGLRAAPGVRYRELAAGDAARLGRWRLRVLGPPRGGAGTDNRRSLVLLAEAGGHRALLTGDLDATGEAALLSRWGPAALAADLLKVGHHGSPSSSSRAFLRAVGARLALLSVGAGNAYGHPSPEVLYALAAQRTVVLRSDRAGMVRVEWGRRWRISAAP